MKRSLNDIQRLVRPIAEQHNLRAVYLFGSYARGEQDRKSDIDLLIDDADSDIAGLFELAHLRGEFEESLGAEVDITTARSLGYHPDKHTQFKKNLMRDRQLIYEAIC